MSYLIAHELERDVTEGTGHTGRGAVVQILARKVSIYRCGLPDQRLDFGPMTRDELIDKIHKVEALFKSTHSQGEMQAARGALERLHAQLAAAPQLAVEFKFSLTDPWKRQLFLALVRRHGLQPYRRPRQRYTTIMVRLQRKFLDEILWPEYLQLSQLLHDYLDEATRDVISRAVHRDLSEAAEIPGLGDAME